MRGDVNLGTLLGDIVIRFQPNTSDEQECERE